MRLVVIESPFGGTPQMIKRNRVYLRAAIRDCFRRHEAPFASHEMYTHALSDAVPEEREMGIRAGMRWGRCADLVVFYIDLGMSPGMIKARHTWSVLHKPIEDRRVPDWTHGQ